MLRYQVRLPARSLAAAVLVLAACCFAISAARGSRGRFTSESALDRVSSLAQSVAGSSTASAADSVISDAASRFEGNSFGGAVMQKQSEGYGVTGFEQLKATLWVLYRHLSTEVRWTSIRI